MHVSLSDLTSSVCMPRHGIAGSYGSSSSSFLRNLHTVLHSGCNCLLIHKNMWMKAEVVTGYNFSVIAMAVMTGEAWGFTLSPVISMGRD